MRPEDVMPTLRERGLYPAIIQRLGVTAQALYAWRVVPADRVVEISKLSRIPKHVIRPDIFPDRQGRLRPLEGYRTRVAQRRFERTQATG
jgi:hypothetical protein